MSVVVDICNNFLANIDTFFEPAVLKRHSVFHLERCGCRSFSQAGPTLWNALPEDLHSTECMDKFKIRLKTYYFKIAFNV